MNNLFSFSNIYRCYLRCRKKKRSTANALRFETRLEDSICELEDELKTETYQPARSVCFVAKKPKLREIFAADFKDRIVHHILVDYLEKILEPKFIFDSWACLKKKGNLAAVRRLQKFTRSITSNNTEKAFYLQMDIKSFFVSLDKNRLFEIIMQNINGGKATARVAPTRYQAEEKRKIARLLKKVLDNDCTKNYVLKGNKRLLKKVPPHKSLFNNPPNKGLPIGNLTSQFFANVYLNELDQFVKHNLKAKYYLRYADDFILLSRDKQQLLLWRGEIEKFLHERLNLELNTKREKLRPISNGIDFLGYIVRPGYLLVRRRVVNNCKQKLRAIEEKLKNPPTHSGNGCLTPFPKRECNGEYLPKEYSVLQFPPEIVQETKDCFSSYSAHFAAASTYRLLMSIKKEFRFLDEFLKYFDLVRPHFFVNKRQQYEFFKKKLSAKQGQSPSTTPLRFVRNGDSPHIFFFQSGCFYEFYGDEAELAVKVLGITSAKKNNDRVAGFPVGLESKYAAIAVKKGYPVYVFNQVEDFNFSHRQAPRVLTRKYEIPVPTGSHGRMYES
ncbi:MAG: hypothetical protein J7M11_02240 [Elusimicrobia bacterium]|nr:hypothetical protein [Elusimicrobiota bacterium]